MTLSDYFNCFNRLTVSFPSEKYTTNGGSITSIKIFILAINYQYLLKFYSKNLSLAILFPISKIKVIKMIPKHFVRAKENNS